MPLHSSAHGTDLHEALREKAPVRAASTATVALAVPGATIDGVALAVSDRILLKNQSAPAENGIYVWSSASTALVRATDALSATDFVYGFKLWVREGTTNGATHWVYSQSAAVTIGTTALTFVGLGTGSGPIGPTGTPGANGVDGLPGPPGSITITGAPPYVCIQDQKPQNTAGGTFTSGAWRTRVLNTFIANDLSLATLATNQITLPAGRYRAHVKCPADFVNHHQGRLQNITSGGTLLLGTTEMSQAAGADVGSSSFIMGRFDLASVSVLEVQHQCITTNNTNGFGSPGNITTEVYTVAEFWLEGGPPPFRGRTFENPNLDKTLAKSFDAITSLMTLGRGSLNIP